jgi:hypothetical protein
MNLPGEPTNDRRAVPRHIRDGEHDGWEDTMAADPAGKRARTRLLLIYLAVLLAVGFGLWFGLH